MDDQDSIWELEEEISSLNIELGFFLEETKSLKGTIDELREELRDTNWQLQNIEEQLQEATDDTNDLLSEVYLLLFRGLPSDALKLCRTVMIDRGIYIAAPPKGH